MDYTQKQLDALNSDQSFAEIVEHDKELNESFNSPDVGDDHIREDIAASNGISTRQVFGLPLPPPSPGHFALLEMIGNAFLTADKQIDTYECMEVVYVATGDSKRVKSIIAAIADKNKTNAIKFEVLDWAQTLQPEKMSNVINQLTSWLALCGGFEIINADDKKTSKKKA